MNFQNANPGLTDIKAKPAGNENARATPSRAPARSGQATQTLKLATRGDIRAMLILVANGAIDLWAGHRNSPNLDRFEALHAEHSATLAACPDNVGGKDLGFLLRRARMNLQEFGETTHREIIQGIQAGCEEKALDAALECVKNSAIAAAASLASIELALAKG